MSHPEAHPRDNQLRDRQPIDVRRIDDQDEAALRAWWEVGAAACAERPDDAWPEWQVSRVALRTGNPERAVILVGAFSGSDIVGAGRLVLTQKDNLHLAVVDVYVAPGRRRTGVGQALAIRLESMSREDGRTTILSEVFTNPGDIDGAVGFALKRGYLEANVEEIKVLDLATYAERESGLVQEVEQKVEGYRIVDYVGAVPEQYVEGFCSLLSTFMSQIPLGEVDLSDSEWTPARLREHEEREQVVGSLTYGALAVAPDGTLVGCTDLSVSLAAPRQARIGITLVSGGHRGHRLGLALKVANHRAVRAEEPSCERVVTSNAGVNAHMNAVNDLMGYRVVETLHEMQKVLP